MTNSKIFSIISKVQLLYKRSHLYNMGDVPKWLEGSALEMR